MTDTKFFSKSLLLWRKSKGMTQEELGKKIGLSRTIVSFLENGKQAPQVYHLELLKDKLNLDLFDAIKEVRDDAKPYFGTPRDTEIAASAMGEMYNSIREVKRDLLLAADLFNELDLAELPAEFIKGLKVIEKIILQANRKI